MLRKWTYPLTFEFKLMAFAPQFFIRDQQGNEIAYVKQKLFKLKEDITVFSDSKETQVIYKIKANQWIDWSASYVLSDAEGNIIGKMGRKGVRSLWKATYEISNKNDVVSYKIEEANAFVKIMDGLFSSVPVLGVFTGYVFNPTYNILNSAGEKVAQFSKEASFFGKKFTLNQWIDIDDQDEEAIILSLIMMVFLERARG